VLWQQTTKNIPEFSGPLSKTRDPVRRTEEGHAWCCGPTLYPRLLEDFPMRFMIIIQATAESEQGCMPTAALMTAMARYHEELARAGVLLDASGLQPSAKGWRIEHGPEGSRLLDGPFTESKELIAGYTLIQVRSRDEALEWARRFPAPFGEG